MQIILALVSRDASLLLQVHTEEQSGISAAVPDVHSASFFPHIQNSHPLLQEGSPSTLFINCSDV